MSNDYARSVALVKALEFWGQPDSAPHDDTDVLATAEKFRAFLTGEPKAEIKAPESGLPKFKLPKRTDGYLYFRFRETSILYRSDLTYASMAGGVDRINAKHQTEWVSLGVDVEYTRVALRSRATVAEISASLAAKVIAQHMEGVQFE